MYILHIHPKFGYVNHRLYFSLYSVKIIGDTNNKKVWVILNIFKINIFFLLHGHLLLIYWRLQFIYTIYIHKIIGIIYSGINGGNITNLINLQQNNIFFYRAVSLFHYLLDLQQFLMENIPKEILNRKLCMFVQQQEFYLFCI